MTAHYVAVELDNLDGPDHDVYVIGPYRSPVVAERVAERLRRKIAKTRAFEFSAYDLVAHVDVLPHVTPGQAESLIDAWVARNVDLDEDDDE